MEKLLNSLIYSNTERVYFGKTGCLCGCGGKYHESERMFKTAVTKIQKFLDNPDIKVEFIKFENSNEGVVNCEREGRAIVIYVKDYTKLGL